MTDEEHVSLLDNVSTLTNDIIQRKTEGQSDASSFPYYQAVMESDREEQYPLNEIKVAKLIRTRFGDSGC